MKRNGCLKHVFFIAGDRLLIDFTCETFYIALIKTFAFLRAKKGLLVCTFCNEYSAIKNNNWSRLNIALSKSYVSFKDHAHPGRCFHLRWVIRNVKLGKVVQGTMRSKGLKNNKILLLQRPHQPQQLP